MSAYHIAKEIEADNKKIIAQFETPGKPVEIRTITPQERSEILAQRQTKQSTLFGTVNHLLPKEGDTMRLTGGTKQPITPPVARREPLWDEHAGPVFNQLVNLMNNFESFQKSLKVQTEMIQCVHDCIGVLNSEFTQLKQRVTGLEAAVNTRSDRIENKLDDVLEKKRKDVTSTSCCSAESPSPKKRKIVIEPDSQDLIQKELQEAIDYEDFKFEDEIVI